MRNYYKNQYLNTAVNITPVESTPMHQLQSTTCRTNRSIPANFCVIQPHRVRKVPLCGTVLLLILWT